MLKEADIHEKGSKEWRDARNKIRKDFEEEKKSKIENKSYNIDPSGSADQAPAKTKTVTRTAQPVRHHSQNGGNQRSGNGGGQAAADKDGGSADSSPF